MRPRNGLTCLAVLALLASCSGNGSEEAGPPDDTTNTAPTEDETSPSSPSPTQQTPDEESEPPLRPRFAGVVARGLEVPWGIDFLPDDSALVAERDSGAIVRITPSGDVSRVGTVPGVQPTLEGGLLGLAVSPAYETDQRIFVYLTTSGDNRVLSMTYDGQELGEPRELLTDIPAGQIHDGGRLEFGPDGKLYISTGEAGNEQLAQDRGSLGGKILRINRNGSIPNDNPNPDSPVWTTGHRNIEGLAFDSEDRLWATEFGQDLWDEVNLIEKGNNYGWPAAEGKANLEDFTDPLVQWRPENASPAGAAFASDNLWAAALRGARLWRIPVRDNGTLGKPRALLTGEYGRLRTVVVAPDGSLWVTTSNHDGRGDPAPPDDRILRITLE